MRSIRLRSPSKINLHLRVGAPDATGFHPLRTWFVTTDLCDELRCSIAATPGRRSVVLLCDDASIPTDATNLVVRAATAYLDAIAAGDIAVDVELTKRVPAGTGLGGGSANAAATLVALDALLSNGVALATLAATLGSDVPFFLGPPSAIATGRGERLVAAPPPMASFGLLLLPPFGVSTPAAYRALDVLRPTAPAGALDAFDVAAWSRLDAIALSARLANDLEPAAFAIEPRLADLRDRAEAALGRPVRMSGSGSTLFALYDDRDAAEAGSLSALRGLPGVRPVVVRLGRDRIDAGLSPRIL